METSEGPRATKKTPPLTVGRGPVPRHATNAGETLSDARMETSEGPRATGLRTVPGTVGRWENLSLAMHRTLS